MTLQMNPGEVNDGPTTELSKAFECIYHKVFEGLLHGHFRYEISCSVGKNLRRELTLHSGISYKFTIALADLPH